MYKYIYIYKYKIYIYIYIYIYYLVNTISIGLVTTVATVVANNVTKRLVLNDIL